MGFVLRGHFSIMTVYRVSWILFFVSYAIIFTSLLLSAYLENYLYFIATFLILLVLSFTGDGIKCPECGTSVYKLKSGFETSWPRRKCSRCGLDFSKEVFSRK